MPPCDPQSRFYRSRGNTLTCWICGWNLKFAALFDWKRNKKYPSTASLVLLWGGPTSDRWIPLTKGQWCGKCLNSMMSSWNITDPQHWFSCLNGLVPSGNVDPFKKFWHHIFLTEVFVCYSYFSEVCSFGPNWRQVIIVSWYCLVLAGNNLSPKPTMTKLWLHMASEANAIVNKRDMKFILSPLAVIYPNLYWQ